MGHLHSYARTVGCSWQLLLSGGIEGPSDTDTSTHIHDPRTDSKMIAIIGTTLLAGRSL